MPVLRPACALWPADRTQQGPGWSGERTEDLAETEPSTSGLKRGAAGRNQRHWVGTVAEPHRKCSWSPGGDVSSRLFQIPSS